MNKYVRERGDNRTFKETILTVPLHVQMRSCCCLLSRNNRARENSFIIIFQSQLLPYVPIMHLMTTIIHREQFSYAYIASYGGSHFGIQSL